MTREVDSIIAYNAAGNTGCYAAYTTNGKHGDGSHHNRQGTPSASGDEGLAVDFNAPNNNPAKLKACAEWFLKQSPKLFELFYTPLGKSVKRGQVGNWTIANHSTHVHVAVTKGTFLPVPTMQPPAPTPEKALTLVIDPVGVVEHPHDELSGWAFGRRGHVYHINNARHYGGWDDATRNDPKRWCVALVPTISGNGYWLVSNMGEIYAYGDAPQVGRYQTQWGAGVIIGAWRNGRNGPTLVRDDGKLLNRYALPA